MSADYGEEQEQLRLEIDVIEKYVDVNELTQTIVNEYIKKNGVTFGSHRSLRQIVTCHY